MTTRHPRIPLAPRNSAIPKARTDSDFQTVRITAWFYAFCCAIVAPLGTMETLKTKPPGVMIFTLLMFGTLAGGAVLAVWRKRFGYYVCLFISVTVIPAAPMGTVLGLNMLRALRGNRDLFRSTVKPT